jgi:hypothetical protein
MRKGYCRIHRLRTVSVDLPSLVVSIACSLVKNLPEEHRPFRNLLAARGRSDGKAAEGFLAAAPDVKMIDPLGFIFCAPYFRISPEPRLHRGLIWVAVVSPENDPVAHPPDLTCFEAPNAAERIQCEMMGSSATPRLDAAL